MIYVCPILSFEQVETSRLKLRNVKIPIHAATQLGIKYVTLLAWTCSLNFLVTHLNFFAKKMIPTTRITQFRYRIAYTVGIIRKRKPETFPSFFWTLTANPRNIQFIQPITLCQMHYFCLVWNYKYSQARLKCHHRNSQNLTL